MNSKPIFYFKEAQVHGFKASAAGMVGLPPLTAVTGLGAAFAALLAQELGFEASEISCAGTLLAFDTYTQHEGYKKGLKVGMAAPVYEAMVSVWASAQVNIAFELRAHSDAAHEALTDGQRPLVAARTALQSLNLAKGVIQPRLPRIVQASEDASARSNLMKLLPSHAELVVDASAVVAGMRDQGLPLMQGLTCATLKHADRPEPFKSFFGALAEAAGGEDTEFHHNFLPVQNGFTLLKTAPAEATRIDFYGNEQASLYASPTLSLALLMPVKNLRQRDAADLPFWTLQRTPRTFYCTTI